MPSHLPLLLNPLLNALFNNPQPAASPLKDIYHRLLRHWEDGIVIVVPPLDLLLNYADRETELSYSELCYMEEFLRDHIITTTETKNAKLFLSLSGKEVLIKKDLFFTGKGYGRSLRLNILKCEYFQNFNDYLQKGKRFMLMYVDGPLTGFPVKINWIDLTSPSNGKPEQVTLADEEEHQPLQEPEHEDPPMKFEQVIRSFPLVSRSIGGKYEHLFRTFNVRGVESQDELIEAFTDAVDDASHIFQTLNADLVNSIINASPSTDLNECVYNYIELNLHDKIWKQLCELNQDTIEAKYAKLDYLSINQVSLPDKFKADLQLQSLLEKRVARAIVEFQKLELTGDSTSKIDVFVNTVTILSNFDAVVVDADTLVGLLLLVVSHTGVLNLENHVAYVQSFSFQNIETGIVGYALSTFEGLMYFLKDAKNMAPLEKYSMDNKKVFEYVDTKELVQLKKLADSFDNRADSPLKSRNTNGDSLLMQAIQSNNYETWKLLIDYENIYPLEDIMLDQNTSDTNLLNAALAYENFEIVDEIVEILLTSCSVGELIAYLNAEDTHQRTIGHYLFHYPELIPKLAPFINWTSRDINGQTPLFAVCRSYDCPDYDTLMQTVFKAVNDWYADNNTEFDYEDHIDFRGNTLLHIIGSRVDVLLQTSSRVNVNEYNKKMFTPLMMYVRYNRIENIKEILQHPSLNIAKTDKNYLSCLDHSKNSMVSDLVEQSFLQSRVDAVGDKVIGLVRVRLDDSVWKLVLRGAVHGEEYTVMHSFKQFKNIIELIQMEFPNAFLPLNEGLKKFEIVLNFASFNKLKLNKIIDDLNNLLQAVLLNKSMSENELIWNFLKNPEFDYPGQLQTIKLNMMKNEGPGIKGQTEISMDNAFSLVPEEVSEMNFFLKFSLKELVKLRSIYDKLFKVVSFQSRKALELKYAQESFADARLDLCSDLTYLCKVIQDSVKELVLDDELCDKVLFLSLASDQMIVNINDLVNRKMFKWWKLYGELIEMNNTYKKFKFVELKKTQSEAQEADVIGLVDVNENTFEDLTSSTNFEGSSTKKAKKKAKPGFLTNFIESKRSKFEAKLLENIKEVKNELSELNRDIKGNHEMIAMELNNFFIFKTDFLKLTLKKYIAKQIEDLKFSTLMFERGVKDLHT